MRKVKGSEEVVSTHLFLLSSVTRYRASEEFGVVVRIRNDEERIVTGDGKMVMRK